MNNNEMQLTEQLEQLKKTVSFFEEQINSILSNIEEMNCDNIPNHFMLEEASALAARVENLARVFSIIVWDIITGRKYRWIHHS